MKDRAALLAKCRDFFAQRDVLEVDVPILSHAASIDTHIELIKGNCCHKTVYLHTSPEYGMKQLLAEGIGDIYQLSHVFRDHEQGARHTPEFMMLEWYRMGFTLNQMIEETIDLISLFLEQVPEKYEVLSYRDAFLQFAGKLPSSQEERDALFAFEIEPYLGQKSLTVISGFPPEQGALSQIGADGFAERFEIYYQGVELANGYHELLDPIELKKRMELSNQERKAQGKEVLPIDTGLIKALEKGIPDCCGVAVGFDRLMLLRHQTEEIRDVSCFFIR